MPTGVEKRTDVTGCALFILKIGGISENSMTSINTLWIPVFQLLVETIYNLQTVNLLVRPSLFIMHSELLL